MAEETITLTVEEAALIDAVAADRSTPAVMSEPVLDENGVVITPAEEITPAVVVTRSDVIKQTQDRQLQVLLRNRQEARWNALTSAQKDVALEAGEAA